MNKIHAMIAVAALALTACDAHIETPDMTVRPGHVLCDDGTALSYAQYKTSGKQAVAVVFDTGQHGGTGGNGYAVYLWDIAPQAFADSLGVEQGTSADTEAFDGNANTFALYDTQETRIPSPCTTRRKQPRLWRQRSSTCGATDRVHTFHQ